jgi:hypothetical protein
MAQAPRIGVLGMGDPGAHAHVRLADVDRPRPPLVTQPAQAIAEAAHVVLGQGAQAIGMQLKAEKRRRMQSRGYKGLGGMQPQAAALQIACDSTPPLSQQRRIVMKQGEVVHIPHIRRAQHLCDEVIEAVEIEIGEELAGEIPNRQAGIIYLT